jgi:predicted naringenin-chalcone synthase
MGFGSAPPDLGVRRRALAIRAARRALENGAVAPEHVTHLITVSCTGFVSPGVDNAIVD